MSTTVHIPKDLLSSVDKKAKEQNISRNKYICRVLEKDMGNDWPDSFLNKKFKQNKQLNEDIDEMMSIIKFNQINKKPVKL